MYLTLIYPQIPVKTLKSFSSEEFIPINAPMDDILLQDGGMYENIGIEALFDDWPITLREDINTLLVSDASAPLLVKKSFFATPRQLGILTDQVRSLRTRGSISFLRQNPGHGYYLQLGKKISEFTTRDRESQLIKDETIAELHKYKTDLSCMSENVFSLFIRYAEQLFDHTSELYPINIKGDRE